MNGGKRPEPALQSEEIKDLAADWLWRQQAAEWSEADQAALDEWLAQSRYHLVAYWRLKAAWQRTERLAALRPLPMKHSNVASSAEHWPKLRFVAAACAIAALVVAGTYRWNAQEDHYETAVGQRATVRLADGSQIELNTNSAIAVSMGLSGRKVELKKGEAFFRIRHNATRPFTVLAAGHRITDLGTEFSVRTSGSKLEMTLVQGRARLETASDSVQRHSVDLTPGEVAIATADTLSVSKLTPHAVSNALAWRQGKVVFNHVTLAEAAAQFNRYNRTKLIVLPDAANLKVSGTFDAGSIGPFTNMATLAFGLHTEQHDHSIQISRANTVPAGQHD